MKSKLDMIAREAEKRQRGDKEEAAIHSKGPQGAGADSDLHAKIEQKAQAKVDGADLQGMGDQLCPDCHAKIMKHLGMGNGR